MEKSKQEMNIKKSFKYYAFISYNAKDTAWGKKLQRKLEHYRMPATLCSEHGWERTPIKPVFFAPTDMQPGELTEELQERLKASRNLIVIYSPNSAKSEWVGKEIEFYHNLGRTKNIHFFIVDGSPHSGNPETECFNPVIDQLGLPEILGANIHEPIYRRPWLNRERAYVQLISKLLGVEFDAIWQRHKRQLIQKAIAWTVGGIVVFCVLLSVWHANQPVDVAVQLNEASVHNENLPPMKDAVVTLTLDNETKSDTIRYLGSSLTFSNIPHHFLDKSVNFTVTCRNFQTIDTTLCLGKQNLLNIYRNPNVFGDVRFSLWDPDTESYVTNTTLQIEEYETITDWKGYVSLFIPLSVQDTLYHVKSPYPLMDSIIHMPCGENDVLVIKH